MEYGDAGGVLQHYVCYLTHHGVQWFVWTMTDIHVDKQPPNPKASQGSVLLPLFLLPGSFSFPC